MQINEHKQRCVEMESSLSIEQIIYCSRARNFAKAPEFERDVRDTLSHSRAYNPLHDITGVLMTDGEMFAQVVEGPAATVRPLYARIANDRRHGNVTMLQHVLVHVRLFRFWPIAFMTVKNIPCVRALDARSGPAALRKASIAILKALRPVLLS